MLQTLRNNMKLVLWITIIFFVLLIFLVWGADLQFGGTNAPTQSNVIGLVNGDPILAANYQQLLSFNRQNVQAQGRELEPTEELRIEEETWGLLVDEILVSQEARRRGLTVKDSEVRAVLMNDPPPIITQDPSFRNEQGQFDLARFQAILRDPATPETFLLQLEAYVRDYLPTQKLETLIRSSVKVTDEELRRAYARENEQADLTYVLVDVARLPIDATVSDEEAQAYFQEHAEDFQLPRRVDLTYVMVPRRATAEDSLRIRRDLEEMAEEAREYRRAEAEGRENLGVSDFATLAASFSETPNAEDGGLLPGFLKPTEMSPALASAVAGLEPGDVTEPYLDGAFYHIAQVADVQVEAGDRAYQLRDLGLRIAPSDSTIMAEQERLEELRRRASSSGLMEAAQEAGLAAREVENVLATGFVPGLASLPNIGAWAHQQEPGTVSRILGASNAWYVVEVGTFEAEGVPPLEAVRDRVNSEVLRQRRLDAGRARAEALVARVRGGASLEEAARADSLEAAPAPGVTRVTGVPALGRETDVLARAFLLPVGDVSEPIAAARGWVVLRVDARPEADWTAFETAKDSLRRALQGSKENQVMSRFLEELRGNAKVVDYRS